ncbi:TIGR04255 family protein [Rhodohalobacter sp.]|uniref:TIGR04255 family protein n=1 Tax=Rhodohalobacter sp. TaxID=1974210 RepID=UPI002ACD5C32|nr:TIGR04255 family protein [Rhodohalobacter sp.]MDZ7755504.1 TIGR04255 family protein [Rhodohalobacter sp.]
MKLPAKIEPCPILESVIEVRFSSNEISEAIFGLFQREIRETLPKYERLGILDLPEAIRRQEPNLKYKPHFKFTSDEYDVNLGPKCHYSNKEESLQWLG